MNFNEALQWGDPITIRQFRPVQQDVEGIFVNGRVERSTVPEGWYAYDLVEGDDDSFCAIRPYAVVNHGGTILLKGELAFPKNGTLILMNDEETNEKEADADYTF